MDDRRELDRMIVEHEVKLRYIERELRELRNALKRIEHILLGMLISILTSLLVNMVK
jgi:hypothetical protein